MIACDVNVLLNAQNASVPEHPEYFEWFENALNGPTPVGIPSLVFSGYLRIITNPRVFERALKPERALEVVAAIRTAPAFVPLEPGHATGRSSPSCAATRTRGATWCRTRTSLRSRSSTGASGSRRIAVSAAIPA